MGIVLVGISPDAKNYRKITSANLNQEDEVEEQESPNEIHSGPHLQAAIVNTINDDVQTHL